MEHKKQTGHVCRWMVFGITIVTIVVGCTIVIGLFPDFVTQKCPFCNWLINNILYLCIPLFWGTQKVF